MEVILSIGVVEQSVPQNKINLVYELSASAKGFFKERSYSLEVETVAISFIMVKNRLGYEEWHKERKPRYVAFKNVKSRLTGETFDVSKRVNYDLKFSDELIERFVSASDEQAKKIIALETLASLQKLDALPKKIKDFDKGKFKADMQQFFIENILGSKENQFG